MKLPTFLQGCLLSGAVLCAIPFAFCQAGLPTSQPKMLTIVREYLKPGMAADHAKHEAGWPAAYEKAKSPDYYIALSSLTGAPQVWYVVPVESHAALAASMKREDKDSVLSAELDRLSRRDAEFINGVSVVQAVGRPDLSLGIFPDTAKSRFYEVITFSVRPGQGDAFEKIAKAYGTARKRVSPDASYRTYSVIAGMVAPTYLVFISVDDYAKFDQLAAEQMKVFASLTAEEKAEFDKWRDVVVREETNRFRLDPIQSYVPKEARAQDPEFWMPK